MRTLILCVAISSCSPEYPKSVHRLALNTGFFAITGNMVNARRNQAAVLLADGKVLISGGWDDPDFSSYPTAEIYDPTNGLFSRTRDMNVRRQSHTATLLSNGTAIVMGGTDYAPDYGDPTASVEIFDPANETFSSTIPMNVPRSSHTATTLTDGKILVTGGSTSRAAEIYDPDTGSFVLTASMASIRGHHAAILLNDGTVLVTGGWGGLNTAELYDPTTGIFDSLGSMVYPHTEHTATLLPNGQVLIAGGRYCLPLCFPTTNAELYDPATRMFTATGSLSRERSAHTATLLTNGRVLIAGGRIDPIGEALSSAEVYDFDAGQFESTGNMTAPRADHTATGLLNGQVLVAGPFAAAADLYTPSP